MSDPENAFTFTALSRRLNVSLPTIYRLISEGLGPRRMRIGGVWRVSPNAAAELQAALENPDGPEAAALREYNEALANPQTEAGRRAAEARALTRERAVKAVKRRPASPSKGAAA